MWRTLRQCQWLVVMVLLGCWSLTGHAAFSAEQANSSGSSQPEIVIYGATPAGIAAAIEGARAEKNVLLITPYQHIGGLVTNGLSHTDFRTFEGLTGTFLEFTGRVQRYYNEKYGADSPHADCFRGTHGEPHVNRLIFQQMLDEHPHISLLTAHRLVSVDLVSVDPASTEGEKHSADSSQANRIQQIHLRDATNQQKTISGLVFIDATYEGDLLAAAGVPYHVGREAKSQYGETLAAETEDAEVQGYNFRFVMTQEPENRVLPSQPKNYQREDFLPLLDLFSRGQLKSVFCAPTGGIYKYQPPRLPNNKYDINDVSRGLVRLSLPQINNRWPEGNAAVRADLFQQHLDHQVGMLYFLQNDADVPEVIRAEARSWGFCQDEFTDSGHIPAELYVREGRRLIGQYVFTENDTNHAPGDARSVLHTDAIAMGDYGPNCHGTDHEGPRLGGKHIGEFYKGVPPYQIPYGSLVPKQCQNLLVPVACSSSHVGFCALRLEPIWTSLGQAAGVAAGIAVQEQIPVQQVEARKIQQRLHQHQAATLYVSDVLPGHPDFAAVQWWGTLGGLHGVNPAPAKPGQRGQNILGQYYEAYPGHTAQLELILTPDLLAHWQQIARDAGLTATATPETTRGEFLRNLWQQHNQQASRGK